MQFCNKCWMSTEDDTLSSCPHCGEPFPGADTGKKKKGRAGSGKAGKLLGLIAGGLGGIALVVAVIFGVMSIFGTSALGAAAQNSVSGLVDELRGQSNLASYLDNMDVLDKKSDCRIIFGLKNADAILALDMAYAGSDKLMAGTVSYVDILSNTDIAVDFHANKKEVRLSAPELVTDVYGFTYSDFQKKYDKSAIRKALGLPSAEALDLKPFQGFDMAKFLKKQAGDSWDAFEDSLKIEEYTESQLTLGSRTETCTVYRVHWSADKASRMFKSIAKNTLGILPDSLLDLIALLDPDLRCYVDSNDNLVGVDFTFMGSIYTFLLEGDTNPWELVSLTVRSATGTKHYTGGLVTDSSGARIELKANDQTVHAIYYNDNNGEFSVVSPNGVIMKGIFKSDNSGIYLECQLASTTYVFSISGLDTELENNKNKYVDLMDMGVGEASRLVIELCNSLGVTAESLGIG